MHDSDALSRRRFIERGAGGAAVLVLAPLAFARQSDPSSTDARVREFTLRASAFNGAPDGRPREIWGYDSQLPGPTIRVREGDRLRIKVFNDLSVPTSVHWHGMHQMGTWRMDGADGVSAPPIPPGQEFVYEFVASPAGTHWYHSHVGVQYGDGLNGPLIVEEATPIAAYDRDEILMMNDWFLEPGDALLARVLKSGMGSMKMSEKEGEPKKPSKPDVGDVPFESGLINGKGRAAGESAAPLTVLSVKPGERIRLRLINASSTYAFRFQVDGHPLTVIATDGMPVKPVTVDNLVLANGERYDVILAGGPQPAGGGNRWIRAVTLDGNETRAILRYDGAPDEAPKSTPVTWGARQLSLADLRSREPVTLATAPREIPLVLGGSMTPYRWSINDQYFPKADALEFEKGDAVRFVFRNPTGMDHPFHMHGHSFHVLGKPDALNVTDPPLKDTINVRAGEDVVIQWVANNPGRWFFHCHIEWHLATGMARVLEINPIP